MFHPGLWRRETRDERGRVANDAPSPDKIGLSSTPRAELGRARGRLSRIAGLRSFSYYMPPKPYLWLAAPPSDNGRSEPVTFEVLFARYSGYVAGLASRLLGSGDADLDDVVQDVFWLASRRIDKIRDVIQARGWLATVTTRVVRRKLMRRRFRALFHASSDSADVPARGATAEEHAMLTRLYEVLEGLPTDLRLAWSLRYLEGEPLDAVAAACGCSLATTKRRVAAAKSVIDEVFRDD